MRLTSSNFAAAMGLSPWMSRQKLYRVMVGEENRDPLNANMQWGIGNEHRAVSAAEAITGLLFMETGENQVHHALDCYGTTPDGRFRATGLEVKCPQKLTDEVPDHYLPQVQGQMWIADLDRVVFCQWTPDESRAWWVIRSDEYIDAMQPLLADFVACVESETPPKRRKKPVLPTIETQRIDHA